MKSSDGWPVTFRLWQYLLPIWMTIFDGPKADHIGIQIFCMNLSRRLMSESVKGTWLDLLWTHLTFRRLSDWPVTRASVTNLTPFRLFACHSVSKISPWPVAENNFDNYIFFNVYSWLYIYHTTMQLWRKAIRME